MDTLRKIAEDTYLTAAKIKVGDDPDDTVSVLVDLGNRLCVLAGIEDPWTPTDLGKEVNQ